MPLLWIRAEVAGPGAPEQVWSCLQGKPFREARGCGGRFELRVLRQARKAHERKPEDKLWGCLPQFPYKGALPAVGET
jgi:hypothetical protein